MAAPFVVTSRLGNILQMITLAHQTGILRVIRGQGATREMGQIRFIGGEPVSALLGQLTGEAALGVLNNWGECYYAFDEVSVADVAATSLPRPSIGEGTSPSYPQYSQYPQYPQYPGANSGPFGGDTTFGPPADPFDPANPSTPPYRPEVASLPSRPSRTSPLSEAAWPIYSYQDSGLFSSSGGQPAASGPVVPQPSFVPPSQYTPSMPAWEPVQGAPGQAVSTTLLTAVPQRTALAEQVEQLPLDRRERMVLLLVDGQRTVADLARLTRRAEAEVQAVLTHLELLGLVVVGG